MSINEWLFLLSFLAVVGLTIFKAVNVAQMARLYSVYIGLASFIIIIIAWFVGLQVLFSDPGIILYTMLHRLMSIFLMIATILTFAEIIQNTIFVIDGKGRLKLKDF